MSREMGHRVPALNYLSHLLWLTGQFQFVKVPLARVWVFENIIGCHKTELVNPESTIFFAHETPRTVELFLEDLGLLISYATSGFGLIIASSNLYLHFRIAETLNSPQNLQKMSASIRCLARNVHLNQ